MASLAGWLPQPALCVPAVSHSSGRSVAGRRRTTVGGDSVPATYNDVTHNLHRLPEPGHLRQLLDVLLRLSYQQARRPPPTGPTQERRPASYYARAIAWQVPAASRLSHPAWTLLRGGQLTLAPPLGPEPAAQQGGVGWAPGGVEAAMSGALALRASAGTSGASSSSATDGASMPYAGHGDGAITAMTLRGQQQPAVGPPRASKQWSAGFRLGLPPLRDLTGVRRGAASVSSRAGDCQLTALMARELGSRLPGRLRSPRAFFREAPRPAVPGTSPAGPPVGAGMRLLRAVCGHVASVYCCTFDRTGQLMVTGSDDANVKVCVCSWVGRTTPTSRDGADGADAR